VNSDSPDLEGRADSLVATSMEIATLSVTEILRNFVYVLSHLILPDCYTLYRLAKFLLVRFRMGTTEWKRPSSLAGKLLAIEACAHSGSTFLLGNIRLDIQDSVVTHFHRQWSLRRCLCHGVPTILLIRDPLDVCLSKHSRSVARDGYGMTISMAAALAAWLAYYRYAWRVRDRLCIITFSELVDDFASARQRIEAWSEVRLVATPSLDYQNEFTGERRDVRLSFLSRTLLRAAQALYNKFDLAAHAQRSTQPIPAPLHDAAQSAALSGQKTRSLSLWAKPQTAILFAGAILELPIDWSFSQKFGLHALELTDAATLVFGLIILVNAVRRLDFIERAGSRLSEYESLTAEWDAAVSITSGILLILPGVGCDVVGMMLLLPPIRHFLSMKLAAAAVRKNRQVDAFANGDANRRNMVSAAFH
jgi:UPF0716 family protein affecting phage T7 exclusion